MEFLALDSTEGGSRGSESVEQRLRSTVTAYQILSDLKFGKGAQVVKECHEKAIIKSVTGCTVF
jgi:hypothetical protein